MKKKMKKSSYLIALSLIASLILIACNTESIQNEESINSLVDNSPLSESSLNNIYNNNQSFQKKVVITATRVYTPPTTVCRFNGNINYMSSNNLTFPNINLSESILYELRDKELLSGETGVSYIKAFYEISELQEDKNFSINELNLLSNILPKISESYNKLNNENYSGVIIDEQLKNEIISVINFYKTVPNSNNSKYLTLITAIESDLEVIVNRNRDQVLEFLQN